jgi:hypothetical protein
MSTRITFDIKEDLSQEEREGLKLLLRDALNEYVSAHLPVEKWAERTYPAPEFNDGVRTHKAKEMTVRVSLCAKVKRFNDIRAELLP